jgi:plasmid stability protein
MIERFIGYFRLVDACALAGCPVCRSLEEDGRRHLDAIMYEQVNDPDTRQRLHGSWGFCNAHAWMLLEIASAASGAAILYEDVIGRVLRRVRRLGDRVTPSRARLVSAIARLFPAWRGAALVRLYRRRRPCPVCAWSAQAEANYIGTVLRFIDDPPFARAYAASEGLCLPHLLDAIERGAGTAGLVQILERTGSKWDALRRDLDRFVGKHDYRNTQAFSDDETSACRRAVGAMTGGRGRYGGDRPGPSAYRAGPRGRPTVVSRPEEPAPPDESFERGRLDLRVRELTTQLGAAQSRAAALHYRLSQVAEDRNALELNLSGERGANALAMRTIADLRAENERLSAALDVRGAPTGPSPREA